MSGAVPCHQAKALNSLTFLFKVFESAGLPPKAKVFVNGSERLVAPETIDAFVTGLFPGDAVAASVFSQNDDGGELSPLIAMEFKYRNGDERRFSSTCLTRAYALGLFDAFDWISPLDDDDDSSNIDYDAMPPIKAVGVAFVSPPINKSTFERAAYVVSRVEDDLRLQTPLGRIDLELLSRLADPDILYHEGGKFFQNGDAVIPRPLGDLFRIPERLAAVGGDIELFQRLGRRSDRKDGHDRIKWLVDGVIPAGTITLLAGAQGTGKSTLATELSVAVAKDNDDRRWLGRPVVADNATGVVAILSGEDGVGIINSRLEALDPNDSACRLMPYAMDSLTLPELCEVLAVIPKLSLVIVDPARRYLVGDEDGSDSANTFFSTLESLAARTGAAVLVLHHLTKNAAPSSLQAVREAVRGSGVWLDRPRVMLAIYRRRDLTMIGVAKHNIPPAYPMMTETAFARDSVTLKHIQTSKAETAADAAASDVDDLELKALTAIQRLRADGQVVLRRGAHELWALQPVELNGIGRNRIREIVDALIDDGLVAANAAGLEVVE